MASLRTFSNLTYLEIDNAERITDAGMAHLIHLPRLVTFNFSWCTRITDAGFAHLRSLSALTNLSLKWANLTDDGLRAPAIAHQTHLAGTARVQTSHWDGLRAPQITAEPGSTRPDRRSTTFGCGSAAPQRAQTTRQTQPFALRTDRRAAASCTCATCTN